MFYRSLAGTACVALFVCTGVVKAQQDVHVHGQAQIDLAIENGRVDLLLRASAQDLVGFEHAPVDTQQQSQIQAARKIMLDHASLWRFSAGSSCVADKPIIDISIRQAADKHDDKHDDHHSHEEKHQEDKHKDHDHKQHDHDKHDHDSTGGHSDWQVRYRFNCATVSALKIIETNLFQVFPSLQSITVQVLDTSGARQQTLTATNRRIVLEP